MITFDLPEKVKESLYVSYPEIKGDLDTWFQENTKTFNKFLNFIMEVHATYHDAGYKDKDILPWVTDIEFIKFLVKVHGAQKVNAALMLTEFRATEVTSTDFESFLKRHENMASIPFAEMCAEQIEKGKIAKSKKVEEKEKPAVKVKPETAEKSTVAQKQKETKIPEKKVNDETELTPEESKALSEVKSHPNLAEYIEEHIRAKYNTTAVKALDLLNWFTEDEAGLELIQAKKYKSAMYGLAINIDESCVEEPVNHLLACWETNEYAISVIDKYLIANGSTMETLQRDQKRLLNYLPADLKQEKSPDIYKLYRAVLIMEQRTHEDANAALEDADARQTYIASMEDSMETSDIPFEVANHMASDDVSASKGLLGKAGNVVGSVVKLKYSLADDYNSAMKQALGDYTENYEADREAAQAKKQAIKEQRQLRQEETYNATSSLYGKASRPYEQGAYSHRQMNRGYRQSTSYNQFSVGGRRVPPFLIAIGIHVLIVLLIAIFAGWGGALIPAVGCVLASIGWVKQRQNIPDWWKMMLGGYAVFLLGWIFL